MADPSAAALAWALGGDTDAQPDRLSSAGAAPGAPGVLRRLFEAFSGSPTGPHEQQVLDAAVHGLTIPDFAMSCTITVEVQPIRLRTDGVAVTAGVGLLLPAGTILTLTGVDTMKAASIIRTAAGAVIDVAYWT